MDEGGAVDIGCPGCVPLTAGWVPYTHKDKGSHVESNEGDV